MLKTFIVKSVLLAIILLNFSLSIYGQENYAVKTIVIDAGHGGKDPGNLRNGAREKDIVLAVALKLGAYIEKYLPDVKVIYTRDKDEFIDLNVRAQIANKNNADLFISIHANSTASETTSARGTETFVMGLSHNKSNLALAMRENSVIKYEDDYESVYDGFDPTSDESYIMFSLFQNVYQASSIRLAEKIENEFSEKVKRNSRGVKMERLLVLWKTTMPSVLVELGFVNNEREKEFLISEQGQSYLASGIFRAVRDYKNEVESINAKNSK